MWTQSRYSYKLDLGVVRATISPRLSSTDKTWIVKINDDKIGSFDSLDESREAAEEDMRIQLVRIKEQLKKAQAYLYRHHQVPDEQ